MKYEVIFICEGCADEYGLESNEIPDHISFWCENCKSYMNFWAKHLIYKQWKWDYIETRIEELENVTI